MNFIISDKATVFKAHCLLRGCSESTLVDTPLYIIQQNLYQRVPAQLEDGLAQAVFSFLRYMQIKMFCNYNRLCSLGKLDGLAETA